MARLLYQILLSARLRRGWSQAKLAALAGVQQSQISMFENGQQGVLSRENVRLIAELLGVDIYLASGAEAPGAYVFKLCLSPTCPGHTPWQIDGKLVLVPRFFEAPVSCETFCPACAKKLSGEGCSGCSAPILTRGAFCPNCGHAYVDVSSGEPSVGDFKATVRTQGEADFYSDVAPERIEHFGRPGDDATED